MEKNRFRFLNFVLSFIIALCILILSHAPLLQKLDLLRLDMFFQQAPPASIDPRIIIVEITDYDIEKIGRWPWNRSWLAAMTVTLKKLGARAVFLDMVFSEPSTEFDDAAFETAMREAGNVYLPLVFGNASFDPASALLPLPRFASAAKGIGPINMFQDIDGIFRRTNLAFPTGNSIQPGIPLAIAADVEGLEVKSISNKAIVLSSHNGQTRIPLLAPDTMMVNWAGGWEKTFKHHGFLEILDSYAAISQGQIPSIDVTVFKDSICLVGITAVGLFDIKATPVDSGFPGVGISASILNSILKKQFFSYVPQWLNLLILAVMCLLPALIVSNLRPLEEMLTVVAVALSFSFANMSIFNNRILMDLNEPLLGLFLTYVAIGTTNFFRIYRERQQFFKLSVTDSLTGLYNIRYFKMLLETEIMLSSLPNANHPFCLVMTDIDHFKNFNDNYGHQVGDMVLREVSFCLKSTLRSSDIVARYGGEEIIMILRGTVLKDALAVTEKMRKNIENIKNREAFRNYPITASFGVSAFKPGDTIEAIIARADEGMYVAKGSGRNMVCTVEDNPTPSPFPPVAPVS